MWEEKGVDAGYQAMVVGVDYEQSNIHIRRCLKEVRFCSPIQITSQLCHPCIQEQQEGKFFLVLKNVFFNLCGLENCDGIIINLFQIVLCDFRQIDGLLSLI